MGDHATVWQMSHSPSGGAGDRRSDNIIVVGTDGSDRAGIAVRAAMPLAKGMGGMKRFVKGSVHNSVAHECNCDILIVDTDTAETTATNTSHGFAIADRRPSGRRFSYLLLRACSLWLATLPHLPWRAHRDQGGRAWFNRSRIGTAAAPDARRRSQGWRCARPRLPARWWRSDPTARPARPGPPAGPARPRGRNAARNRS